MRKHRIEINFIIIACLILSIVFLIFTGNKRINDLKLYNKEIGNLYREELTKYDNLKDRYIKLKDKVILLEYCKKSPIKIYTTTLKDTMLISAIVACKCSDKKVKIK
jgi:hypothetical protein